jgi:hypothetical protein
MTTRRICVFILVWAAFMLGGCFVGVSRVRYSVPYLDDPKVATQHVHGDPSRSTLSFADLRLSVYSANAMNGGDVLLFPVPWSMKVSQGSSTYKVFIGIRADKDGFVLDAADIYLIRGTEEKLKPTRIFHISECGKNQPTVEWSWLPIEPIVLRRDVCINFAIEFNIHPQDPTERFSILFAGLSLDGAPHGLPEVRFKEARRLDPFGAP